MTTKEKIEVMQAYEKGKTIERRTNTGVDPEWHIDDCPEWDWSQWDYRVMPDPPRMTNRELARFLGQGCGQKWKGPGTDVMTYHTYRLDKDDDLVDQNILIRPWGCEKWIIPSWDEINRLPKGEKA